MKKLVLLVALVLLSAPSLADVVQNAGSPQSSGNINCRSGFWGLDDSQTEFNTACGLGALRATTTGKRNTAIGWHSQFINSTGNFNTSLGYNTLAAATTAGNNTAIGYQALQATVTGGNNTALGYQAGLVATGTDNTIVGLQSGLVLTTGTNNTIIGAKVSDTTLTTGSNNILIGKDATIETPAVGTNSWLSLGDIIVGSMAAPALTSCGTSPTTPANDIRGTIVTGSGATACTMTFATAKAAAPSCVVSARSGVPPVYTTSTAALTLTTAAASATYDFFCSGK